MKNIGKVCLQVNTFAMVDIVEKLKVGHMIIFFIAAL